MSLSELLGAGSCTSLVSFFAPTFFLLFLPISVLGYAVMPKKLKKYYLLIASYVFFWLISGTLAVYLIGTTLSMYGIGLWLNSIQGKQKLALEQTDKENKKAVKKQFLTKQRWVIALAVLLHIGTLLTLKYTGFFATNVNKLFALLGTSATVDIPRFAIPIGISFFSLQALSYLLDVYRGVIPADRNIFRLALFISFFPQIVEGPICRYSQTADKLWECKPITYQNLSFGLQRFLFGMLKKIVIADRLDPFIKSVFDTSGAEFQGGVIAFAAVCYTVQLYMDFSGSIDAVMGMGQIFGIEMPENFQRPFFSKTISEFWQRWHITLGTWFRDYIFYPITSSGKMKKLTSAARKKLGNHYGPLLAGAVALFCVWFSNGLWHGSAWSYVFFGMYHFALILGGSLISPLVKAVNQKLHIKPEWFGYRVFQMIRTTILVIIGELFFRAMTLKDGLRMFLKIVTDFNFSTLSIRLLEKNGVDYLEFIVAAVTLVIVFVVSVLNEKGICIRESLSKKNVVIRWSVLLALIIFIVIFGAYGIAYKAVDPLYAQF